MRRRGQRRKGEGSHVHPGQDRGLADASTPDQPAESQLAPGEAQVGSLQQQHARPGALSARRGARRIVLHPDRARHGDRHRQQGPQLRQPQRIFQQQNIEGSEYRQQGHLPARQPSERGDVQHVHQAELHRPQADRPQDHAAPRTSSPPTRQERQKSHGSQQQPTRGHGGRIQARQLTLDQTEREGPQQRGGDQPDHGPLRPVRGLTNKRARNLFRARLEARTARINRPAPAGSAGHRPGSSSPSRCRTS